MGDLFSGKSTTKGTETANSGPSTYQKPYLDTAFNGAQAAYDAAKGTPYYTGQTYAGMTPAQKATLDNLKAYATGTGLSTAGTLSSMGTSLAGNASKAASSLDEFKALAGTDATAANIAAAGQYAANPYIDAQIDANSRDVTRNLHESMLPSIDRAASGSGNLNSSRAGVASGIAQRGAADRIADISAQLRGDAYSQGLTLAQGDRAQNLSALSTAANGYAGLASTGINAIGAGNDAAYKAYGAAAGADSQVQADEQGKLDAAFKAWQGGDTRAFDLLNKYYGVVGSNQWGSSATSTSTGETKSTPSLMQSLLQAGATAAAFMPRGK